MNIRIPLLLAVVTAMAVPSYAQKIVMDHRLVGDEPYYAESSYSNGEYLDNPCTAVQDWVWVNYSAYVISAQEEAGRDDYRFNESTNVDGTYAASGASESNVGYSAQFAVRKYHKVNTPDDFHVVTIINFDPAARSTWITVETACGNGMPDSAQ